jgi:hypothetical protein
LKTNHLATLVTNLSPRVFPVALWTMKVMEHVPDEHLLYFFCIDYTVWPGQQLFQRHYAHQRAVF